MLQQMEAAVEKIEKVPMDTLPLDIRDIMKRVKKESKN